MGFKGHTFCMKISKEQTIASIVNDLPRTDISNYVSLKIYGAPGMGKAALAFAKKTVLKIRLNVILEWLNWFKNIGG